MKFQDFAIQVIKIIPDLTAIFKKPQTPVHKHLILPNPAASAEKAVGETFEEDIIWRNHGMESPGWSPTGWSPLRTL